MVLMINTTVLDMILTFLCPVNSVGQFCEKIVFELYLIKYRDQIQIIQIQASLKSQI